MALIEEDVISLVNWDPWKTVFVKSKDDYMKVRTGSPQKAFWEVWKTQKEEIKALGIFVKREERDNDEGIPPQWIVNQWRGVTETEKNQAKQDWKNKQNSSTTG